MPIRNFSTVLLQPYQKKVLLSTNPSSTDIGMCLFTIRSRLIGLSLDARFLIGKHKHVGMWNLHQRGNILLPTLTTSMLVQCGTDQSTWNAGVRLMLGKSSRETLYTISLGRSFLLYNAVPYCLVPHSCLSACLSCMSGKIWTWVFTFGVRYEGYL